MSSERALKHVNLKFWKKKTDDEKLALENKPFHPDDNDSPLVCFLKLKNRDY
jgi:hypothetical protein